MNKDIKQHSGSFFAELGAVIASISILALVGTSYMDSTSGKAQTTQAYTLMKPLILDVNSFYDRNGSIGGSSSNYTPVTLYSTENTVSGENDDDDTIVSYAGRFVQEVKSLSNGVVFAQLNEQYSNADLDPEIQGKVNNVQSAIQGEYIIMVPFLIGEETTDSDANTTTNPSDETTLRWACLTTINANPPTGQVLAAITDTTSFEQYYYAPGCTVISKDQAACLDPNGSADTFNSDQACTGNAYVSPKNFNSSIFSIVDNS
jgi:hypothetical protein